MGKKLKNIVWSDYFEYDEANPITCLVWKDKFRVGNKGIPTKRVNQGRAGCLSKQGYPVVYLNGWPYSAKKVIWEMFNGPIPKGRDVMNIDGGVTNCKISNLELSTEIPKDSYKYGEHLKDFFYYDEDSPSGLRWKKIYKKGSNVKVGDVVGHCDQGYWKVRGLGLNLKAHKIVWALHNEFKNQDGMHIDHIDGNPSNNKIENLRLVPLEINARNKPMMKSNTSGIHGVCFQTVRTKSGNYVDRYVAGWRGLDGKPKTKTFSVNVYGQELAEFLATEYRQHQIDLLNLMGAGYTERHGV